jgi:predicted flap endonuclease-1-like 5' DNA nuclease
MTWLLAEILAFVLAAAVFGVLIGLGLAAAGANRRAVSLEKAHGGLVDQIQSLEQAQRAIEVRAEARSAAEAAVRGDLEGRMVEFETSAEEYRARAEAAERQLRVLARPDYSPRVEAPPAPRADQAEIESLKKAVAATEAQRSQAELDLRQAEGERDAARAAAEAATGGAEAERARSGQEIESLALQLATAERVRAKCEAELAMAHARAEAVMRSAAALMGAGNPLAGAGHPWEALGDANGNGAFSPPTPMPDERDRPPALAAPRGGRPDDLRRIRGIGPRNEGALNALGLYHFDQVAGLSAANVAWLDAYLRTHGRIAREDWVGQAKSLLDARARPEISDKVRPEDAGF